MLPQAFLTPHGNLFASDSLNSPSGSDVFYPGRHLQPAMMPTPENAIHLVEELLNFPQAVTQVESFPQGCSCHREQLSVQVPNIHSTSPRHSTCKSMPNPSSSTALPHTLVVTFSSAPVLLPSIFLNCLLESSPPAGFPFLSFSPTRLLLVLDSSYPISGLNLSLSQCQPSLKAQQ